MDTQTEKPGRTPAGHTTHTRKSGRASNLRAVLVNSNLARPPQNTMDSIEQIDRECQELFDRRAEFAAESQRLQIALSAINAKLLTTLPHKEYRKLAKGRGDLAISRISVDKGLADIKASLRDLALRNQRVKRADAAQSRARDMMAGNGDNEILPGQMGPVDLVVLAFREFTKLDRKGVLDKRQQSIMSKMAPYAQDRAERQKRLERQKAGM